MTKEANIPEGHRSRLQWFRDIDADHRKEIGTKLIEASWRLWVTGTIIFLLLR